MADKKGSVVRGPRDGAAAVANFWQAGVRSRRRLSQPAAVKSGRSIQTVHAAEAAAEHFDIDTLQKARRAAAEYTRAEIQALAQQIRRHSATFGATHVIRLLAVKDRKARDKLTNKAITSGWSVRRLERAIQAHNGPRGYGGKNPTLPTNERERLMQLLALTVKWQRWCAAAADGLPEDVAAAVKRATAAVDRVNAMVMAQFTHPGEDHEDGV